MRNRRMLRAQDFPSPGVQVSHEAEYLFQLAFSESPGEARPADLQAMRLVAISERTGLLARAGWKLGARRSDEEDLFLAAARGAVRRAAVQHLILINGLKAIGEALAGRGIPWTVLKFGALALTGVLHPGQREAGDLDILIDVDDLLRATEALKTVGFLAKGGRDLEHQVDPLYSERLGVCVDLHKVILGVRHPGSRRSLTQSTLHANGLAVPASAAYPSCFIPKPEILLAHAAVHGLAHHGFRPSEYPLFRLPADVIDLAGGGSVRGALLGAAPFLRHTLDEDLIEALANLCEGLRSGVGLTELCQLDLRPCSRLVRHMLASSLSTEYASSLEFLYIKHLLSDRLPVVSWASLLFDRTFLTRSEAERLSGKKLSGLGYLVALAKNPSRLWAKLRKSSSGLRQEVEVPIAC